LEEVRPGQGNLDYVTFLGELDRLDPDTPIMLEHLPNQEEYALAAEYIRTVAQQNNIRL
jgi:sugar phosphate isomerase/epimerase